MTWEPFPEASHKPSWAPCAWQEEETNYVHNSSQDNQSKWHTAGEEITTPLCLNKIHAYRILTLLWYHESYVDSTMGSNWNGLYSIINKQGCICLRNFQISYIGADRENVLQNPNNLTQHFMCEFLIILHHRRLNFNCWH